MSAAGHHGRLSRSASSIVAKKAEGFHLLRIDGYSETKKLLPDHKLSSQVFAVGGHSWRIDYYPNGHTNSNNAISVYLQLIDNYPNGHHQQQQEGDLKIQAQYAFSLLDHTGNPAYELPGETDSFTGIPPSVDDYYPHNNAMGQTREEPGPGCGHEEFITTEELETRPSGNCR